MVCGYEEIAKKVKDASRSTVNLSFYSAGRDALCIAL